MMENNNDQLLQVLKDNLEVRDRKWHAKTYKQCFLHSHAVQFVMKHGGSSEESAVAALNELRLGGYIQHVVDPQKPFKVGQSKKLYFCFLDDENAHVIQTQKAALEKSLKQAKITPQVLQGNLRFLSTFMLPVHRCYFLYVKLNNIMIFFVKYFFLDKIVGTCSGKCVAVDVFSL